MNQLQKYRQWFEYEKEMHQKVLAAFETIPEPGRSSSEFQNLLDLFSHLLAARHFWLYRIGYLSELPKNLFEAGADVLAIDASDGFSEYQATTLKWITKNYPDVSCYRFSILFCVLIITHL